MIIFSVYARTCRYIRNKQDVQAVVVHKYKYIAVNNLHYYILCEFSNKLMKRMLAMKPIYY